MGAEQLKTQLCILTCMATALLAISLSWLVCSIFIVVLHCSFGNLFFCNLYRIVRRNVRYVCCSFPFNLCVGGTRVCVVLCPVVLCFDIPLVCCAMQCHVGLCYVMVYWVFGTLQPRLAVQCQCVLCHTRFEIDLLLWSRQLVLGTEHALCQPSSLQTSVLLVASYPRVLAPFRRVPRGRRFASHEKPRRYHDPILQAGGPTRSNILMSKASLSSTSKAFKALALLASNTSFPWKLTTNFLLGVRSYWDHGPKLCWRRVPRA